MLLLSAFVWAQSASITLKNIGAKAKSYEFPLVISDNAKIADKINTFLQVTLLSNVPKNGYDPFIGFDGSFYNSMMASMEWERLKSPENVLSIAFHIDVCGAYCEFYDVYHHYDLRTGDKILLKSLFTKEGFAQINERYKKDFSGRMAAIIKRLEAAKANAASEDLELYNEQIWLYKDCKAYDLAPYMPFYFSENSLILERERCSNHAMRAIDDFEEEYKPYSYTFKEIEEYLSPYGLSLIGIANKYVDKSPSFEGKIFKGTIGKYPITALIEYVHNDGSLSMVYWYDKHKTLIFWGGKVKDNNFEMTEYDNEYGRAGAVIKAQYKDGKISGNWTNSATNKTLPLQLSEY